MTYFSVVIPTYNRLDMLLRVLDALQKQTDAPEFETIVINDGSTDDTDRVLAQRAGITFRSQPNSGPGRARNHGVSLAKGRFVIFIGDDTVPEPRFLAEHARIHRESGDDPLVACLGYTGWPRGERVTAFMDYINDYGLQFGYRLIEDGERRAVQFLLHVEHLHRPRAARRTIRSTRRSRRRRGKTSSWRTGSTGSD